MIAEYYISLLNDIGMCDFLMIVVITALHTSLTFGLVVRNIVNSIKTGGKPHQIVSQILKDSYICLLAYGVGSYLYFGTYAVLCCLSVTTTTINALCMVAEQFAEHPNILNQFIAAILLTIVVIELLFLVGFIVRY